MSIDLHCRERGLRFAMGVLVPCALALGLSAQEQEKNRVDEVLPLPSWSDSSEDILQSGQNLWPKDFNPNDVIHPAAPTAPIGASEEDKTWSRFLPRLFSTSSKNAAAAVKPLVDMPADAWRACEEMPADTRLFDPEGLLAETQAEDMRRLLSLHSGRDGVVAALVLLDARQKLPAGADLTHLAGGKLTRNSACIIVYSLGEPDRARVFFTQNVGKVAETSYLEGLASACIRGAAEHPDTMEQLQNFAIQLSIRLFWLERAYPALQPATVAPPLPPQQLAVPKQTPSLIPSALPVPTARPQPTQPAVKAIPVAPAPAPPVVATVVTPQEQPPLSEVTPPEVAATFFTRMGGFLSQNKTVLFLVLGALVLVISFLAGAVALWRWNRRRYRQCVWILPEMEPPTPRLGGPHCGASGAFIQYG